MLSEIRVRPAGRLLPCVVFLTVSCGGGSGAPTTPTPVSAPQPETRLACDGGSFPAAARWSAAAGGNDHLYEVVKAGRDITWEEARTGSSSTGSHWHLATITSSAENDFVEGLLARDSAFFNCCLFPVPVGRISSGPWLGASSSSSQSNDWRWVTGEPFNYADWGPLEPFRNGDRISYAEFGAGRRIGWNDISSGHTLSPQSYVRECSPDR